MTQRPPHSLVIATNALLPYSLSVHELGQRAEIAQRAGSIADLLLRGLRHHRTTARSLRPPAR